MISVTSELPIGAVAQLFVLRELRNKDGFEVKEKLRWERKINHVSR